MKIAIVADSHFDEHSRFQECVALHAWIQGDAHHRGCSALLHAGDIFERRSTPRERSAVADWLRDCAITMDVVVVRGNHDALEEHDLWPQLRAPGRIETFERPGITEIVDARSGSRVAVATLPWPQKAHVEAAGADAREAMRAVLRGLGDQLSTLDCPRVLLTHAMVRGSKTSTGQELLGCELELGLEDLALARADLYALGHIHAHQHWMVGDAPAIYPGSPRRANFGELEPKGYVVAEFDGRRLVGWEFVETPATPMVHVDATWIREVTVDGAAVCDGALVIAGLEPAVSGAEVRLRVHVPADSRDAARRAAQEVADRYRAAGAVSVKVEEQVLATTRARTPEVARATTLVEKLEALWSSRKDVPDPVRREAIVSKLGELEGAA
jgi:exonuclease SbcD